MRIATHMQNRQTRWNDTVISLITLPPFPMKFNKKTSPASKYNSSSQWTWNGNTRNARTWTDIDTLEKPLLIPFCQKKKTTAKACALHRNSTFCARVCWISCMSKFPPEFHQEERNVHQNFPLPNPENLVHQKVKISTIGGNFHQVGNTDYVLPCSVIGLSIVRVVLAVGIKPKSTQPR